MHRRENRFAILKDRAGNATGIRHRCRQRGKRSRAKPDRSSLRFSPTAALPQGSLHRKGEELELMLTLRYGVTFRASGLTQARDEWFRAPRDVRCYSSISSCLFSNSGTLSVIVP
jgi:hypothetical protein